jgi:hypothetical protein
MDHLHGACKTEDRLNEKSTKWLHRSLVAPQSVGRSNRRLPATLLLDRFKSSSGPMWTMCQISALTATSPQAPAIHGLRDFPAGRTPPLRRAGLLNTAEDLRNHVDPFLLALIPAALAAGSPECH